jgi:hypothetical protein
VLPVPRAARNRGRRAPPPTPPAGRRPTAPAARSTPPPAVRLASALGAASRRGHCRTGMHGNPPPCAARLERVPATRSLRARQNGAPPMPGRPCRTWPCRGRTRRAHRACTYWLGYCASAHTLPHDYCRCPGRNRVCTTAGSSCLLHLVSASHTIWNAEGAPSHTF